jgi:hypothetical protein
MEITLSGVILALLFVLPGAVWINYRNEQFPTKKLDATELFITSIGYSVCIHLVLILLFYDLYQCCRIPGILRVLISDFINTNYYPNERLLFPQIFLLSSVTMAYILFACFIALLFSWVQCKVRKADKSLAPKLLPIWLNFFSPDRVNYVKINTSDGLIYVGQVKHYSLAYDDFDMQKREIILTKVSIIDKYGFESKIAPKMPDDMEDLLLLDYREIKNIMLIRKKT